MGFIAFQVPESWKCAQNSTYRKLNLNNKFSTRRSFWYGKSLICKFLLSLDCSGVLLASVNTCSSAVKTLEATYRSILRFIKKQQMQAFSSSRQPKIYWRNFFALVFFRNIIFMISNESDDSVSCDVRQENTRLGNRV